MTLPNCKSRHSNWRNKCLCFAFIITALNFLTVTAAERLDSNWLITVGGQTVAANADGSFLVPNISAPDQFGPGGPGTPPDFLSDDFIRAIAHTTSNGVTRYAFTDYFQFRRGETFVIDGFTFTETPPTSPVSLKISIDNATLTSIGQAAHLHVIGTFQDGSLMELTPRTNWTVYRTSNPKVATVGPDGLVMAVSAGVVFFTAANNGASAVVQATVAPGDSLTAVEGLVRGTNNTPVTGATVAILGQSSRTGVTDASGDFSITNVATTLGNITVQADYQGSSGFSSAVAPVPGGLTDAGIIAITLPTPVVVLAAPAATDTLYQGSTIPIIATTAANVTISSVSFSVNGATLITLSSPPYAIQYPIAIGATSLTIAVTATRNTGQSTTVQHTWAVQPDPLTTVTGVVVGTNGLPVSGITVRVFESSNVTGGDGRFSIPGIRSFRGDIVANAYGFISGGSLIGHSGAFRPVLGGITEVGTITLTPITSIPNGGFETGDFTYFLKTGNSVVTNRLGSLLPVEGARMAFFSSGNGAVNSVKSTITSQPFIVPAGKKYRTLEYDFVSNEYPQYIGSQYDDTLRAVMVTPTGTNSAIITSVNRASFVNAPTNTGFTGMTGFKTVQINVSNYAGVASSPLTLSLEVFDVGDTAVDSGALIDNIRFESDLLPGATLLQFTPQNPVALLEAVPKPLVMSLRCLGEARIEVNLCGGERCSYVIEASTDLIHWTPLCTNICTGNTITFTDPEAQNLSARFYRAVQKP